MSKNLCIFHTFNEQLIYAKTFNKNIIWIKHYTRHKGHMALQWQSFKPALLGTMPCQPANLTYHPTFKAVTHLCNACDIYSQIFLTFTDFLLWVRYWTRISLYTCITSFNLDSGIFAWTYLFYSELLAIFTFDACLGPLLIAHLYWYSSNK